MEASAFFADTLEELKYLVQECNGYSKTELKEIRGGDEIFRFVDKIGHTSSLAYLLLSPAELKYKPFESLNNLSNAVKRHGDNIQTKESKFLANIIGISLSNEIIINDLYGLCILPADELLNDYVFADDGSLCGELAE